MQHSSGQFSLKFNSSIPGPMETHAALPSERNNITTIEPQKGWNIFNLPELWSFRELIYAMILRDIKVRYKQTVIGVAWAVIQPVSTMIIFTIIFGKLANIPSDGYPYSVFVFSGLLAWNFFAASVSSAGMSLMSNAHLISKVYFPRIIIPVSSVGVAFVDFLIACVILLILMVFYNQPFTSQLIFLPLFLFGLTMVSMGVGFWLAAVTVAYRDFRYVISYMIQIWMYLTPIIYPISFVPENWRWVLYLNPMYAWIEGIRSCFLGKPFDYLGITISLALSVIVFAIGVYYFHKAQRRFADII